MRTLVVSSVLLLVSIHWHSHSVGKHQVKHAVIRLPPQRCPGDQRQPSGQLQFKYMQNEPVTFTLLCNFRSTVNFGHHRLWLPSALVIIVSGSHRHQICMMDSWSKIYIAEQILALHNFVSLFSQKIYRHLFPHINTKSWALRQY